MRVSVIAIACVGCAPVPPFHTLETADVLAAKQVGVTLVGGAGGGKNGVCCGGGGARLRYGIDGVQEVGLDATVLTDGSIADVGSKLAYKRRLAEHFAIVVGGGATYAARAYGTTVGGDVALVASTRGPGVQLYGALRATAAKQLTAQDPRGVEAGIATIGVAVPTGAFRLLGEIGGIAALQQSHQGFDGHTPPLSTYDTEGFYFAAGIDYAFGR